MPVSIRIIDIPSSETIESDTKLLAIDPTNRVTRLIAANTFINLLENSLGDIANSGLEIAILAYAQANAAYAIANAAYNQANTNISSSNTGSILAIAYLSSVFGSL